MNTTDISFPCHGVTCRGRLFGDASSAEDVFLITGAIGQVQEQAPLQYAQRLAGEGRVGITFDHRYFGLSEGEPRQFEHPERKTEDIIAAAEWVKTSGMFPAGVKVNLIGICKGGAYGLRAARLSDAVDRFIGVSGFYFDEVSLEVESGYRDIRLKKGQDALAKYEATGEVEYLPIVHETREDAALPYPALYAWYSPWEGQSNWENRYAVMSDAFLYDFYSAEDAQALQKPALIIHGERSTNPGSAQRVFDQIPHEDKTWRLYGEGVDFQTNFYDREPLIERVCAEVKDWLEARKAAAAGA